MSANRIRDYLYRSSEENEEKKKEKKIHSEVTFIIQKRGEERKNLRIEML